MTGTGVNLALSGSTDMFLVKYDGTGTASWSARGINTDFDMATDLAITSSNSVIVTGYFSSTSQFGSKTIVSSGGTDIFLVEYLPGGMYYSVLITLFFRNRCKRQTRWWQ